MEASSTLVLPSIWSKDSTIHHIVGPFAAATSDARNVFLHLLLPPTDPVSFPIANLPESFNLLMLNIKELVVVLPFLHNH